MADTNEGFQRKYFLISTDRQQECVLVCVNKKNKNQGQVISDTATMKNQMKKEKKTQEKDQISSQFADH